MFFLCIGINRLFAGGLMERAEELYLKIEEECRSVEGELKQHLGERE